MLLFIYKYNFTMDVILVILKVNLPFGTSLVVFTISIMMLLITLNHCEIKMANAITSKSIISSHILHTSIKEENHPHHSSHHQQQSPSSSASKEKSSSISQIPL